MEALTKTGFIVITGPESTGKTELAKQLATHLKCSWVPELSRNYIANLNRPYKYSDVEDIAKMQIAQLNEAIQNSSKLVIFDTGLIITKVWFDVVYKKCPKWLVSAIDKMPKALHLLCDTDIPWVADSVRENGGKMRQKLSSIYINEFEKFGLPYVLVSGTGKLRLANSLKILNDFKII